MATSFCLNLRQPGAERHRESGLGLAKARERRKRESGICKISLTRGRSVRRVTCISPLQNRQVCVRSGSSNARSASSVLSSASFVSARATPWYCRRKSGRVCQARRIPRCLGDDSPSERRHTRTRDVHGSCRRRSTRCRQRWLPTFSRPVHMTLCRTHSGVPALAVIVVDCGRRDPASLAHPTSSPPATSRRRGKNRLSRRPFLFPTRPQFEYNQRQIFDM